MTVEQSEKSGRRENPFGKLNVRWIALGALIAFVSLKGGEIAAMRFVDEETRLYVEEKSVAVAANEVGDEEKERIRAEVIKRFSTPAVIIVALMVLLVLPFCTGILMGIRTESLWSAPVACFSGSMVALISSGALSVSGLLLASTLSLISFPGELSGRKIARMLAW